MTSVCSVGLDMIAIPGDRAHAGHGLQLLQAQVPLFHGLRQCPVFTDRDESAGEPADRRASK